MKTILNLGAGNRLVPGAVNHDIVKHRAEIEWVWDLNVVPWPWEDASFDLIEAIAVLEHLELTLIASCNECWRIIRPGGRLVMKYPRYDGVNAHHDPTHRWFWSEGTVDFLDPDTQKGKDYLFYTPYKWKIVGRGIVGNGRNVKVVLEVRK